MRNINAKLTVIIPFRNEGDEVKNTVSSLLKYAGDEIELILINDDSSDGYDYKQIADNFNATYIENERNLGVATSRDIAVDICQTDYFVMFDAHMRAFTPNWVMLLLKELEKDQRSVLCCTTVVLDKNATLVDSLDSGGYGVTMHLPELSYDWNTIWKDDIDNNNAMTINCIMGASYACNVKYWKYIKGLRGLKSYGLDEQLISIKVFLEGGRCKVLRNIIFGHIFRVAEMVPYTIKSSDYLFNILYLIESFFTDEMKIAKFRELKHSYSDEIFQESLLLLSNHKNEIKEMGTYYSKIFTKKISDISNAPSKQSACDIGPTSSRCETAMWRYP